MTKRILVVEDQEALRGILRDLLTGSVYDVAEATNGRDGVAKTGLSGRRFYFIQQTLFAESAPPVQRLSETCCASLDAHL